MLRKLLAITALLTPLAALAIPGNGNGHAYGRVRHAPEIDGGNAILGIVLLGGIISISRKRNNKK